MSKSKHAEVLVPVLGRPGVFITFTEYERRKKRREREEQERHRKALAALLRMR